MTAVRGAEFAAVSEPAVDAPRTQLALAGRAWPTRLPVYGLMCPLHGGDGCVLPGPEAALAAYLSVSQESGPAPSGTESETVHGLTALLAAHAQAGTELTSTSIVAPVEKVLRAIVRWAETVPDVPPHAPFRLAANYAQLAGRLRLQRGQNGLGMAWFVNGLRWAVMAVDVAARVTILSDMSMLARLEGDAPSALAYARAMGAVDPGRRWVATVSDLYLARGYALDGDLSNCQVHVLRARETLTRVGERDRDEAPWLIGPAGEVRVESSVGGAMRDIAALTASRRAARLAIEATEQALALLPVQMRATHLLLTLRLADSHACAANPDAAIGIAEPVLAEAATSGRATITRELQGLRTRLLAGWGNAVEAREFAARAASRLG